MLHTYLGPFHSRKSGVGRVPAVGMCLICWKQVLTVDPPGCCLVWKPHVNET